MRIASDSTPQYQQVVNGRYLHCSNLIPIPECPWRQDIVFSEGKGVERRSN